MKKKLAAVFCVLVLLLSVPLATAWATSNDLDEIVDYRIRVIVNSDATLSMDYHVEWKVLDSTTEGPLTWVRIGIPNEHCSNIRSTSDSVEDIRYDSSDGDYVRIDLDRAYEAGEVVSFDFSLIQDYMYEMGKYDEEEEVVYEFIPGWFENAKVDNLEVRWNDYEVARVTPPTTLDDHYYVWNRTMDKGERFRIGVYYPSDAFAFDSTRFKSASSETSPVEGLISFLNGKHPLEFLQTAGVFHEVLSAVKIL